MFAVFLILAFLLAGAFWWIAKQRKTLSRIQQNQRDSEQAVDNTSTELRQLIDTANIVIFMLDRQMAVQEWNQFAEQVSGYHRSELSLALLHNIFSANNLNLDDLVQSVLGGKQVKDIELTLNTKDGYQVDLLLNTSPWLDADGDIKGVIGVGQDITALNIAKAQTIQAAKLATLGEMTSSVAHELNQPLNVMRMALGNCRRKLEREHTDLDYYLSKVERVDGQVSRMASIVDHMRMFGRKATESFVPLDMREVIEGSLSLMSEQLRLAGIEVIRDFHPDPVMVIGHRIQVEQVLLNLIGNARDAMNARIDLTQKQLRLSIQCSENQALITVEDNGNGLPEDKIDRIFEPFFTTKEVGLGTGLGLSVSYGIIQDMKGNISAENIHPGARFSISLPLATNETNLEKNT